jgi:hypothetical protein
MKLAGYLRCCIAMAVEPPALRRVDVSATDRPGIPSATVAPPTPNLGMRR